MLHDVFPSGCVALDVALELGGFPRGHLVEVQGDEGTGKTTLGLLALRAAQRAGEEAAFIDVDQGFDVTYARALGVAVNRVLVSAPETGEQALGIARTLLRTGAVAVVVIDSVAGLVPAAELAGRVGDADPKVRRRLIDRGVRDLFEAAAEKNALVVATNRVQMRRDREGAWVAGSAAGDVLPQVASMRVTLERTAGDATTARVRCTVAKNALAGAPVAPRQTDMVLRWGAGVDRSSDILVAAFDLGVVAAARGCFFFDGASIGELDQARAAMLGPLGERVQAAIVAAAPWRRPPSLSADEALAG